MVTYRYRVSIQSPEEHLFRVVLTVPAGSRDSILLALPAWIPGSYKIRDFSRHLSNVFASHLGRGLPVARVDKQTWEVFDQGSGFDLTYRVYGNDLSVRGAHLDTRHAYFNGPSLFLYPEDQSSQPFELILEPPHGEVFVDWQVYTGITPVDIDARGFGLYRAENYAHLIDCPVEMGRPTGILFTVESIPHRLVVSGGHYGDLQRIAAALKSICATHVALFGELPVDDQYLFLLQVVGKGYGGLEHRNSTSLICSRTDLEPGNEAKPSADYLQFLALCSHEYFHLWNGKRISPARYLAPDLSCEVHSELLWVVEGITSYYDELTLVRSGVISANDYLEMLAHNLSRYFKGSGRLRQSVTESSFDAWTKLYQQDENAPNAIVSYYVKGGILVLMLDLAIRAATDGQRSFDHVMRYLWTHFGKPGTGIPEDAMPAIVEAAVGLDLGAMLHTLVHTTEPIEDRLMELLSSVGIGWRLRPPRKHQEKGGYIEAPCDPGPSPPWLGLNIKAHSLGVEIVNVLADGPGMEAGLSAGDVLIALNGLKLEYGGFDDAVQRVAHLAEVPVHFFRGDELLLTHYRPRPGPAYVAELWFDPAADAARLGARNAWMHLSC